MASSAVDVGTGATITFGTSGFTAQITDISIDGIERESIDTTHLGTTASGGVGSKTYIPADLSDAGEVSIEGHFNPDTDPPIEEPAEIITITFDEGATWVGTGFMTAFNFDVPLEDKMTFSATIKFSGEVAITGAS